jgi:ABC-type spermidine/putrescine transport system permease subunit II
MSLGITRGDLKNSLWNTAVCSFPFFAGLGTAWALHKLGCHIFKIREKASIPSLRVQLFACVVGTVFSFPVATLMPDLVHFPGKKILSFFLLTVLDIGGVVPGFYGQRSLYVIGFTGAVMGAFHEHLFPNSQKKIK